VGFISRHVVIIGEGFSKLGILLGVLPFLLFDMLLVIRGGWGVGYLICFHSLNNPPSLENSSFSRTWGPSILYLFLPFVGCFVLLMIGRFSINF
jgi:hypothetical protein